MRNENILQKFFISNYILIIVIFFNYIDFKSLKDFITIFFTATALLTYSGIYLLPAILISFISKKTLSIFKSKKKTLNLTYYITAVFCFTFTISLLLLNEIIFKMYGFHINGFIWNLIFTKGGIASLGADSSVFITSFFVILIIISIEWLLLYFSTKKIEIKLTKYFFIIIIFLFIVQGITYGFSSFFGKVSVLEASYSFPLYQPITFTKQLKKIGFQPYRKTEFNIKEDEDSELNYPLKKIEADSNAPEYNIIWLITESLRWDMLNKDIMPKTYNFALKSRYFLNHYTGGNCTRMGMFTLFYGIYGNYWFKFLDKQRPPVLIDFLKNKNYKFLLLTGAHFTYPELDRTVFAGISKKDMYEDNDGATWERDRRNTKRLIDFIKKNKNEHFMGLLFFEESHAKYNFPPEFELKKDYLKNFNYAAADLEKNIDLIKNRYINSCYHIDSQLSEIITFLSDNNFLKNSIVIITGDHGEEFMEKGRWGHNSAFVDEQLRVPMVIFVPDMTPKKYNKLTSHLDVPATILKILGVKNSAKDYSLGYDMFGDKKRDYTVFANWNDLGYMDNDCKITIPLKASSKIFGEVMTRNDEIIKDASDIYASKAAKSISIMKEANIFTK